MFKKIGAGLTVLGALSATYLLVVGPWQRRWGATDEEVQRAMPGDEEVPHPMYRTTRAVTIHARPEEIWPWIVQLGTGKAGWYSYTWIERAMGLDVTNAEHIMPEFQQIRVGDLVPLAPNVGIPVKALDPNHLLLLVGHDPARLGETSWALALAPVDEQHTRLISRHRGRWPKTAMGILTLILVDPGSFIMMRKMLLGIKERAEKMSKQRGEQEKQPETIH